MRNPDIGETAAFGKARPAPSSSRPSLSALFLQSIVCYDILSFR